MIGIAGQSIADDFGINLGATGQGMLKFLEHHDTRTFAHDETVPVLVVGPRRPQGLIVEVGGKRLGGGKACKAQTAQGGFRAAGQHDIGIAQADQREASPIACAPVEQAVTTE